MEGLGCNALTLGALSRVATGARGAGGLLAWLRAESESGWFHEGEKHLQSTVPHARKQALEVVAVREEAEGVKTLEIAAPSEACLRLAAGMHAAFIFPARGFTHVDGYTEPCAPPHGAVQRAWTVSSHHRGGLPADGTFTISVKREPGGLASGYLHRCIERGSKLRFLGFSGDITLDRCAQGDGTGPVLLLGAGIGVTPLRPLLLELLRAQPARPAVLLLSVQTHKQAAFADELMRVARESPGRVLVVITATKSSDGKLPELVAAGGAARVRGRVGSRAIKALLGPQLGQATTFMCGPVPFMAAMEHALRQAGADLTRVHAETFGY